MNGAWHHFFAFHHCPRHVICYAVWVATYDRTLFQGTAWYYARYRKPYPPALFDLIRGTFSLDGTGRLLDLGAGTGELSVPLRGDFEKVIAVEPDPEMVTEGKRHTAEACAGNIAWVQTTAEAFEEHPQSFRLVTIGTALHWMDLDTVLSKVHALLVPGGGLVIPSRKSFWTGKANWQQEVVRLVKKYLGDERRAGKGTFARDTRRFEDMLAEISFSKIEKHVIKEPAVWNIEQIIGRLYSTSFARRELFGDRLSAFERELKTLLRELNHSGRFQDENPIDLLLAWK